MADSKKGTTNSGIGAQIRGTVAIGGMVIGSLAGAASGKGSDSSKMASDHQRFQMREAREKITSESNKKKHW